MLQTVGLWGIDSLRMALRNHEIDNHLSMTPVNQKDKSSVSFSVGCYSAGDKHSPPMQTLSPVCQRHNNVAGRPHLHHLANNKCNWWKYWLLYHGKEGCPSWPFSAKIPFLHLSSLTFWRCPKLFLKYSYKEYKQSSITINAEKNKFIEWKFHLCYKTVVFIPVLNVVILLLSYHTSPKPTRKSVTNK